MSAVGWTQRERERKWTCLIITWSNLNILYRCRWLKTWLDLRWNFCWSTKIMYFDARLSGSPGVLRRSPLTIGCPRNWMNMWSCDCTMLSPRVSCWRTGRTGRLATGRTRVLLYRLMMTGDEEQIGFDFFWEGLHLHDSLLDFVRKLPRFIQILDRVKLKCRHVSWSRLKWTTNPIHCFNRLWRQATCATCAPCTYPSCKVWCTWITTLRWKCRQGQGQTRPFNHNLETRCPGRAKCLAEDIEQFLVKVIPKSRHLLVLTPKLVTDLKRLEHLGLVSYVPEEQRLVIQKCLGWGWKAPPHDRNETFKTLEYHDLSYTTYHIYPRMHHI